MKLILFLSILIFNSCTKVELAALSMNYLNRTFFFDKKVYTLSDVHILSDKLNNSFTILSGEIVEKSEYNTYIIIEDKGGRLLVQTTQNHLQNIDIKTQVKVFGKIKINKSGYPYLLSYKLNLLKEHQ